MFSESAIDPSLTQADLETDFRIEGGQPFTLRIGEVSVGLLAEHKRHRVVCSAFLTACNPYSGQVDGAENLQRQRELAEELTKRGLAFLAGVGQHPSNVWPGEDGFWSSDSICKRPGHLVSV